MNVSGSQIATGGSEIYKSKNRGDNVNVKNKTITKLSWSYYAIASASGFLGGLIASIIANIIVR